MKIVNITGGLGNQMFQYAFAVALREKWKEEVKVDKHHYHYIFSKTFHGNNFYHNGFEINKVFPNAKLGIASPLDIMRVSYYMPNFKLSRIIRKLMPVRKREYIQPAKKAYEYDSNALCVSASYYEGYWMAYKYFESYRKEIQSTYEFRPFSTDKNRKYADILNRDNSITIHIRRGDYVGSKTLGGICTLDYYRNAIRKARKFIEQPEFFVFSNDQEWCMENLDKEFGDAIVHFVSHNKGSESYRDMQLMSLARCNILANSSFSWWGAYLNEREDNIVFCPAKWHNTFDAEEVCLKTWMKI